MYFEHFPPNLWQIIRYPPMAGFTHLGLGIVLLCWLLWLALARPTCA